MSRFATLTAISTKLAAFDDERLAIVADIVQSMDEVNGPVRLLSLREQELVEQSKQDFAEGRTLSHEQVVALLDQRLAARGVPKSVS
jgi:hypothetical protein